MTPLIDASVHSEFHPERRRSAPRSSWRSSVGRRRPHHRLVRAFRADVRRQLRTRSSLRGVALRRDRRGRRRPKIALARRSAPERSLRRSSASAAAKGRAAPRPLLTCEDVARLVLRRRLGGRLRAARDRDPVRRPVAHGNPLGSGFPHQTVEAAMGLEPLRPVCAPVTTASVFGRALRTSGR